MGQYVGYAIEGVSTRQWVATPNAGQVDNTLPAVGLWVPQGDKQWLWVESYPTLEKALSEYSRRKRVGQPVSLWEPAKRVWSSPEAAQAFFLPVGSGGCGGCVHNSSCAHKR